MKILNAFIIKEFHQIVRDPSSIMIAFVLPTVILFIYMFAINLDTLKITIGLKVDDDRQEISTLIDSFKQNKFVTALVYDNKNMMYNDIVSTKLRGSVIVPNDFTQKLKSSQTATVQVITDGSEVNLANYVQAYPKAIFQQWLETNYPTSRTLVKPISRFWYNQDLDSHHFILPGSLAITMSLIGMLLTALVVAREWERGTMEAIITTKAKKLEFVLGKYLTYFILGMLSLAFNVFLCVCVFDIPFRGNYLVLAGFSGLFLFASLGQGLLISTILKNQFTSSQAALVGGFMPSLMLSGLIYPIRSMGKPFQMLTVVIPARYFVSCLQSEFLAGTIWKIIIPNSISLAIFGLILFVLVYLCTKTRLD